MTLKLVMGLGPHGTSRLAQVVLASVEQLQPVPVGQCILEQVVLVPLAQASWQYQTCSIGSRTGQKRPLLVPWHKPYTHDGGHVLCHGTNSIPRWNLYLFHLCQIVPKSGSTRPWKIQREATHRYLRCNCDSPESDECVRPHGLYVRGVYRQLQRCINSSISRFSSFQMRPTRVSLLQVFLFPSFFFQKNKCCFA